MVEVGVVSSPRAARYMDSSGRSVEKPNDPCTWIDLSITL